MTKRSALRAHMASRPVSARLFALGLAALAFGCTPAPPAAPPSQAPVGTPAASSAASAAPALEGSLAWAIAGPWRIDPERDGWRRPAETLEFFELRNDMTVVEVFPGRGWYSAILAPYLARGGGVLYAASFDPESENLAQRATLEEFRRRFLGDPGLYGDVRLTVLSPTAPGVAPDGSADLVLVFRNVHTFMAEGFAEKAFRDFHRALKPGGILGIEEHRAAPEGLQDPQALSGYVQESYVRALAREAGFEFVGASELNANPKDDRDHPFGVWTLPPTLRTAPLGAPPDPAFDQRPFQAIGESDRMTLKFRKPAGRRP